MHWYDHSLLFLLLLAVPSVDSKYGNLPDKIRNVAVRSYSEFYGKIEWTCHETDIISFNLQLLYMDGSVRNKTVEPNRPIDPKYTCPTSDGCPYVLLPNPRYEELFPVEGMDSCIVRVSAINEQGEGPPSLDVTFQFDPYTLNEETMGVIYPTAPNDLWIESNNGSNVMLKWTRSQVSYCYKDSQKLIYTVHYREISGSDWKTVTTNKTWMVLENLQNGIIYNAYVTANSSYNYSPDSAVIPILIDEPVESDLLEPVITIKPIGPLGLLAVNCSLPPNFNMRYTQLKISFGKDVTIIRDAKPYGTLYTYMDSDLGTAECQIEYSNPRRCTTWRRVRKTSLTWKKNTTERLNDEYFQQRLEQVGIDGMRMIARRI